MPFSLFLFGKLVDGGNTLNSIPAESPSSSLLFLQNKLSSHKFLVDTGASVSVFPHRPRQPLSPGVGVQLRTADGTAMNTFGSRQIALQFGSRRFDWNFLLADVSMPILGSDFLRHHHLLVDVASARLLDAATLEAIPAVSSNCKPGKQSELYAALLSTTEEFRDLLAEYPDVISSKDFSAAVPKHDVRHTVPTVPGPPVFAKARRLDAEKLESARKEFAAMEAAGVIRRSNSPWASPLHMVRKPDGSWRPCGDYRRLNTQTIPDRYPLPNVADFTSRLNGCTVFTKLDLTKGYYQVPMAKGDIPKTAVITPFGLFEWIRMPFGLRNAGCTFQRMMDQILGDVPHCFVYVDDLLIASPDAESHLHHVRQVFDRLRLHGLSINPAKCVFAKPEVEYLGMRVSSKGCFPLQKHTEVISTFPRPVDKKGLQRFLGILNFYRRFIKGAAGLLAPLTEALKGKVSTLSWTLEMNQAFSVARSVLSTVPTLVHPDPSAKVSLAVDASGSHVGAVLQQDVAGSWAPLAFYSKKLSSAESRYSAFDRELFAAYSALRHFRFLLEGKEFVLFTDHKPLTQALFRTSPPWSAMQQRRLSFISEFNCDIRHLSGERNVVADALSRPVSSSSSPSPELNQSSVSPSPITASLVPNPEPNPSYCSHHPTPAGVLVPEVLATSAVSDPVMCPLPLSPLPSPPTVPGISFLEMAELQQSCPKVQKLRQSSALQIVSVPVSESHKLLCDVSTGIHRPLVPESMRKAVFSSIHRVSHPGKRASRRLISRSFVWEFLSKDVNLWAQSCLDCQRSKIQTHVKSPVLHIPVPGRRFSHIHVDLVGPLPQSNGFSYLFTIIDRSTRWPEAVPLQSTTAEECAKVLLRSWIPIFGVPAVITSDRGAQFTSSVWSALCKFLGIVHSPTTSFHPQSNGIVERFHRQLKVSLRSRLAGSDWFHHLPLVLLGLRSVPREDSAISASEALFGSPLVLPGEFLDSPELPSSEYLRRIQSILKNNPSIWPHHSSSSDLKPDRIPSSLTSCSHVFVREDTSKPPLSPLYRGPYLVLSKYPKYFQVQIGSKSDSVSVDRLKPVLSDRPLVSQLPPRRGRPPLAPSLLAPAPSPPLAPTSLAPLQRAQRMKKRVRFSPQQPSPLPVRRNPRREVRDKHRVLHQLHHLDAGGTPVAPLDSWNTVHNNLFVTV